VDFICGAGDVFFNRCLIVTEKRNEDNNSHNVIVAPRTSTTNWGYVFKDCVIRNNESNYHLARGWHTHPRCYWISTVLESPEKLEPERFDPQSIRSEDCEFGEYGTVDTLGQSLTPPTNIITLKGKEGTKTVQTSMPADSAARFTLRNIFPDWQPDKEVRRLEKLSRRMAHRYF
jgi:hypothetical protein